MRHQGLLWSGLLALLALQPAAMAMALTALEDCRSQRHGEPATALPQCESAGRHLLGERQHEAAFEAWMHAAELASQLGEPERAEAALNQAVALLPNVEDALAAHRLARRRGLNAYRAGEPIQALARFLEALAAARAAADANALAISENDLGVTYRHLGNYAAALGHFQASLELREDVAKGDADLGALLANIGSLYLELGDLERADDYLQRALAEHRASGRALLEHRTLEELARIAQRQDRADDARAALDRAWHHYLAAQAPRDQLRVALRRAEFEADEQDDPAALAWLAHARALTGDLQREGSLQAEMISARLSRSRSEQEHAYAELAQALELDPGAEAALAVRAHGRLADLAETLDRPLEAIRHLRRFQQSGAELDAARHGERFDALRVRFDVAQLEAERDRLAAARAQQDAELARRRLETLIVATLALIALALLGFYSQARQYRQRLRSNAERAALERRIGESRQAAQSLRSDLRSMAWLLEQQQAAALVFDAAGTVRAVTAEAAKQLQPASGPIQGSHLTQLIDPELAHWAQAQVESASLEGRGDDADLGTRVGTSLPGRPLIRCRRLSLEEELGVLWFETAHAEDCTAPGVATTTATQTVDDQGAGPDRPDFRVQLVDLMQASLEAWERATRKTRIDLAQASGVWRVTVDDGRLRVRTMDRYLSLETLPDRPRWREVLRTAYFLLAEVELEAAQRQQLEQLIDHLLRETRSGGSHPGPGSR